MSEEIKPVGKIRTALRDASMEIKGGVRINDVLWYSFSDKYPGEVGIHLFGTDIKQLPGLGGGRKLIDVYKEGLRELARRMETEPQFADITQVSAWSTIVHKKPDIMRMMGFDLGEIDQNKKEALATMDKEKFISRYGSK